MIWLSVEHLSSLLESAPSGATIYLLGAGGCGMSALGHLLMDLGFRIAGSDLDRNELVQGLTDRGAAIQAGHREEHLSGASPILVIQSSAIPADNAEAMAAHRLGIPCARRGAALAALIGWRESICIAGMHGKTTTASLMAFALETLRQGSGYAVGSLVPQLKPHGRFCGDSDSLFTKGMIALFIGVLNGGEPDDILTADMGFIGKTGLKEHLAPTRANALNLMATQMKQRALSFA